MNDRNDALLGVVALICCAVVVGLVLVFGNIGQVNVEVDYDAPKSLTYTQAPQSTVQPSYRPQKPAQKATARPVVKPTAVKPVAPKPNKPKR